MKVIYIARFIAVLILILGIIHNIATFTPIIQSGLGCVSEGTFNVMMYMSLICGTSLILSGLLIIVIVNKLVQYPFLGLLLTIIGVFLCMNGGLAIFYMSGPSAWAVFLLSIAMFGVILRLRQVVK